MTKKDFNVMLHVDENGIPHYTNAEGLYEALHNFEMEHAYGMAENRSHLMRKEFDYQTEAKKKPVKELIPCQKTKQIVSAVKSTENTSEPVDSPKGSEKPSRKANSKRKKPQ